MGTVFDKIAESFIDASKTVESLFPKPQVRTPRTPFADYWGKKSYAEKEKEEDAKVPFIYPESNEQQQANVKAFSAYRGQGGTLLADQWRRQAALREGAKQGISSQDVFRKLSGQPTFAKGSVGDTLSTKGGIWNAVKVFGEGLTKLPRLLGSSILQASQGQLTQEGTGASVVDRDWADRWIRDAQTDINKFTAEVAETHPDTPFITELAQFPQNLAYSLTSMGAGLGVGIPIALAPVPGARIAAYGAGTAASGAVAYQMTTYQIMQQYLELKNEESIARTGKGITAGEEKRLKAEFTSKAHEYGLWEAIPEAVSNLAFVGILTKPLTRIVGKAAATKIIGKISLMYGQELLTETVTQKGQSAIEVEAGLREGKISWIEAFKEIAPQTFLLTTVMGGAGQTIVSSTNAIKKIKTSLKKEVGETHPLYDEFLGEATSKYLATIEGITPPTAKAVQAGRAELEPEAKVPAEPVVEAPITPKARMTTVGQADTSLDIVSEKISQYGDRVQAVLREYTRDYDGIQMGMGAKYKNVAAVREALQGAGLTVKQADDAQWLVEKSINDYYEKIRAAKPPIAEAPITPKPEVGTPEVTKIPTELQHLVEEARKYKTFEDFEKVILSGGWKFKTGLMGDVAIMGFPKATEIATKGEYIVRGRKGLRSFWESAQEKPSAIPKPPPEVIPEVPSEPLRATAEAVEPEISAAVPIGPAPPTPPAPPAGPVPMPPTNPPSGRPRTLLDLNREAKGMRALTPEQRAAAMDIAKPIAEDELLYQMKPFKEHGDNLLGPDTPIKEMLRSLPGIKQVVGLWTPAQMERDNPIAMIGVRKEIFEEIETGRARTATLAWSNDAEEILGIKMIKGMERATKVKPSPLANKTKKLYQTMYDLVEHPDHYLMTPEQEKIVHVAQNMMAQNLRDNQRVGVNVVELEGGYWSRTVIKGPKPESIGQQIDDFFKKRTAGGKKGWTKQRAFEYADDLVAAGFELEPNMLGTLQGRLESGIRTFSDQEARRAIAKLPGVEKPLERLESRFPQTLEGQKAARIARDEAKKAYLKSKTVEDYNTLKQAEADYITSMREVFARKIEAGQSGYYELSLPNGRIAPRELVEQIRKYIDLPELRTGVGGIANTVVETTRLVRTTLTNLDLAAGFIQGQVLFYRNNPAWWVAQSKAVLSLIDDPKAYVGKNFAVMDEGMRMGAISIPTEFLFTKQGIASIPTRIPGIGPVMRSCNRAFEWFILVGQTELYKSTRKGVLTKAMGVTPEAGAELSEKATEELVSLGSAIRKELGTESYSILGVKSNQRMFEQLSFFAARFFRALTGFIAQSSYGTTKMLTGRKLNAGDIEAMKGMGSIIAGGLALTIAVMFAKEKKLPNLTDPFAPDWMQVPVGKTYFNFFGPLYPYFRAVARTSVYTAQGATGKAARELTRFLQSKAGIPYRAIGIAGQFAFKGEARTFEGEVIKKTPLGIIKGVAEELVVPISIQEAMQAIPEGRPEAAIAEIFGLIGRASPYNQMDIMFQQQTDINPEGKSYRYASPKQEDEMEDRFPDIAEMMVRRGHGVYGEARRLWDEIDKKYYAQEEALAEEFLEAERHNFEIGISHEEFRDRYRAIQEANANERAGVNKTLKLFQDEKDLPEDPNDRAYVQYFQAYDKARTESGRLDWDKLDKLMAALEKEWTPEQKLYVEENTGLRDHPPLIQEYRDDVKQLEAYWEVPEGKNQSDIRKSMRQRNPELDRVLVRWYGYKPVSGKTSGGVSGRTGGGYGGGTGGYKTSVMPIPARIGGGAAPSSGGYRSSVMPIPPRIGGAKTPFTDYQSSVMPPFKVRK